ncbi:class I SAM-dependent methyltransferase [Glycomyces buryatensis]|uniref:Class I SAM-dependent methyltransferase n=1 Tax=Glycomyces buryatensis TaxID=2570927 RepID=A0A4S8QE72_9ACTN|nr:class I SAM-dependent methyltransferase [Glycomyces buryatensis]THV42907.1 class I SAM-dependent methyltransferase [Glycomyces buryatensis]
MASNYTEVFQDPTAVEKYAERTYAPGTFSSIVSGRQTGWLRGFVPSAFQTPPVHHDFACGTGRVSRMLAGLVAASHGYDTSEAMLAKGRELGTPGHAHLVGPGSAIPQTVPGRPALVTAFRFVLNVDAGLRDQLMDFASMALPDADAGFLLVENHGNASSLRHLRKTFGRLDTSTWFQELSHQEMTDLFDRHGYELAGMQGFTLFTQGCYRKPWTGAAKAVDGALASPFSKWATDVVYIARRR